jgi:hypothetical protein
MAGRTLPLPPFSATNSIKVSSSTQETLRSQVMLMEENGLEVRLLSRDELKMLATTLCQSVWPTHFYKLLLRSILGELASQYPKDFLDWLNDNEPIQDLSWAVSLAAQALAKNGTDNEFGIIKQLRNPFWRLMACRIVVRTLSEKDPERGSRFILSTEPAFHSRLAAQLLDGWMQKDPKAAVTFLQQLEISTARENLLKSALQLWATRDFETAKAWAEANGAQTTFIAALLRGGMSQAAAKLISDSPARNKEIDLRNLAATWVTQDPASALAWASAQKNPRDRAIMMRALLDNLIKTDPAAALVALNYVPSRELRDGFYKKYAENETSKNPTAAINWTLSLNDPWSRNIASSAVVQAWGNRDPTAAASYVFSKASSAQERNNWLNALVDARISKIVPNTSEADAFSFVAQLPPEQQNAINALLNSRRKN